MTKCGTNMGNVFFQFFDSFQGCILGFGILQQSSHIKNVIQVSLNLYLQFVALRVFQFLQIQEEKGVTQHWQPFVAGGLQTASGVGRAVGAQATSATQENALHFNVSWGH